MKKWLILLWYSVYVILLLIHSIHPVKFSISTPASLILLPASAVTFVVAITVIFSEYEKWIKLMNIGILVICSLQCSKVISLHFNDNQDDQLRLVSINASFFKIPPLFSDEYFNPVRPNNNDSLITWLIEQQADFLLIQEFIDDEKSKDFNNLQNLLIRGDFKDYFFINAPQHDNGVRRGMVIFSKWPITKKEKLFLGENRFNGAQLIETTWQGEKIQIVNVHLQSSEFSTANGKSSIGGLRYEGKKIFTDGMLRAHQIDGVLDLLVTSETPTIVAGDFNSTRYSYVYYKMKNKFNNAFEKAGTGFGFSFKGSLGIPVKIDHHFFNDRFEINHTEVVDSLDFSDHYPIVSGYTLKNH